MYFLESVMMCKKRDQRSYKIVQKHR